MHKFYLYTVECYYCQYLLFTQGFLYTGKYSRCISSFTFWPVCLTYVLRESLPTVFFEKRLDTLLYIAYYWLCEHFLELTQVFWIWFPFLTLGLPLLQAHAFQLPLSQRQGFVCFPCILETYTSGFMYGSSYMNHSVKDAFFGHLGRSSNLLYRSRSRTQNRDIQEHGRGGEKFYPGRDSPVSRKRALTVLVPLMTARTSTRVFF